MAEARKMPQGGPGNRGMRGMGPRPKNIKGVLPKMLKILFKNYGLAYGIIFFCIIISAFGSVIAPTFLQQITDNILTPTLKGEITDWEIRLVKVIYSMIVLCLQLNNKHKLQSLNK